MRGLQAMQEAAADMATAPLKAGAVAFSDAKDKQDAPGPVPGFAVARITFPDETEVTMAIPMPMFALAEWPGSYRK